jgi:hypothetical protein
MRSHGQAAHLDVHDLRAGLTDANAKSHDCIPVNARYALDAANATSNLHEVQFLAPPLTTPEHQRMRANSKPN